MATGCRNENLETNLMEAATLNCPMCGAPCASDATACEHCGARLATVACPSCFGMIFLGSKFCPHCGAKVERSENPAAASRPCPRCHTGLTAAVIGATNVSECPHCAGLWIDTSTFNEICADREKQAAVITSAPPTTAENPDFDLNEIHYLPCPICTRLMNRVNFAHRSGVILDICKSDGVWFDRDELRRIVEFIRAGGLDASRATDREQWEAEKRSQALSIPTAAGVGIDLSPDADFRGTLEAGSLFGDVLHLIARML
jgi:Zn-finger nucleic acid-binding protein